MQLDRIDFADIHAPKQLARTIHELIGKVSGPVPVTEIACALDIGEIRIGAFDGFEGMLLTDTVRSRGAILANNRNGPRPARFTVAHELAHFLLERHVLTGENGFACKAGDMRETRTGKWHLRQETEANSFAIELLAPPSLFDPHLSGDPDLRDAQRARNDLDISLEACVRRLLERRPEPLAAVWSYRSQVRYVARGNGFPYVPLNTGARLPQTTQAFRAVTGGTHGFTGFVETHPHAWTGNADIGMFEQTRLAPNGHAVTLLWAELPQEDRDEDGSPPELGLPGFR